MHIWPGAAYPLGATWEGWGSNFALFSEAAQAVELCLFDDAGAETRVELSEVDGFVWHGYLPAISPGPRYGYRVHGPHSPPARRPLRAFQAATRPVRQGAGRGRAVGPGAVRLPVDGPTAAEHNRQRP